MRDDKSLLAYKTGYGVCPRCGEHSPQGSMRERRPNGDTQCGACKAKAPSAQWHTPSGGRAVPAGIPGAAEQASSSVPLDAEQASRAMR